MAEGKRELQFQLFGKFLALNGEGEQIVFSNRKVTQLAALLASQPGEAHDRKWLASQIWPDDPIESSLASLRTALSTMRSDLRVHFKVDGLLSSDRVRVRFLSEAVSSDLAAFLSMHSEGKTLDALQAFPGQLAPDLLGPWAEGLRRKLSSIRALALAQSNDTGIAALDAATQDLENEALVQAAMRVLLREGRPGDAVRLFRQFQTRLRSSFGVSPSDESVALAKQARDLATGPIELAASSVPTGLPPLFGREEWLTSLCNQLVNSSTPLVTLVGTGGLGKTRLAIECANQLVDAYKDRVWFVDLSAVSEPEDAIGKTIQTIATGQDPLGGVELLSRLLTGRPALLVLDNLEQIETGLAASLGNLLGRCPNVTILGTSRSAVGVPSEIVRQLEPLSLPDYSESAKLSPSVELFLDRARSASPAFAADPQTLAQIVRRLEGLPLAICLAAAKADLFSAREILEQLEERFKLLETQNKAWPPRHRQFWACIDWSHRMHPECHGLLKTLTAFKDGWTVKTAQWTRGDAPVHSQLQTLLRASLIHEQYRNGQVRFDMYDSIREFIKKQMTSQESEEADAAHAHALTCWLDESKAKGQAFNAGYVSERRNEYENLRAAFRWSLEHEPFRALRIANGLAYYWWSVDFTREGLEWLDSAIKTVPNVAGEELAMAYRAKATMHTALSDFRLALRALDRGLQLLPQEIEPLQRARYLNSLGNALMRIEEYDLALKHFEEGISLCDSVGDRQIRLTIRGNTGFSLYLAGRLDQAEAIIGEAVQELEGGDNSDWHAHFLHHLGLISKARGHWARALDHFERSWKILKSFDIDPADRSWFNDAACVLCRMGRIEEARKLLGKSAKAVKDAKGKEHLAEAVLVASEIHEASGDQEEAVGLLSALLRDGTRVQRSKADKSPTPDERLEVLREHLSEPAFRQASRRYRGWSLKQIVEDMAEDL